MSGRADDPAAGTPLAVPTVPGHVARRVPGVRARKAYTCPNCHNAIPAGVGHVVAWPDGQPDRRRHWHDHCWRAASRYGRTS